MQSLCARVIRPLRWSCTAALRDAAACRPPVFTAFRVVGTCCRRREAHAAVSAGATPQHVVVMLSVHASAQGQVFSCTPTAVTAEYGFEEFCSVYDFVQLCQQAFGPRLRGIHVSSCYALVLCQVRRRPVPQ